MIKIIYYIINFLLIFSNIFYIKKYLHIYQLKNYQDARFFNFFSKIHKIYIVFLVFFVVFIQFLKNFYIVIISYPLIFFINFVLNINLITSEKTPLVYTNKLKRLFIISTILTILPVGLFGGYFISSIVLSISPCVSNFLNIYDKMINYKYIKSAQKKLKIYKPKIIAITGSNGKTSVKNILYSILSSDKKVISSPKSYNTPLGIAKFINESLTKDCEYIILEYGARHKNDIKILFKLFGADYGIITMVGNQHLQTFKTKENVFIAKSQLSVLLDKKLCIYNLDNIYTLRMFENKIGLRLGVSCFSYIKDNRDIVYANNIEIKDFKTHFDIHINGTSYPVTTKLLGAHNVLNIALASTLAYALKIPINNIIKSIESLEFTPHRLELIHSRINILDDSYNCSLESAKASIDVLSQLKNKKMVATPGIIEGGIYEYNINFELGKLLAKFDYVIIIGNHNKNAIENGIFSQNRSTKILYSATLNEAKKYFSLLSDDDNLLLLNDLPDDYK